MFLLFFENKNKLSRKIGQTFDVTEVTVTSKSSKIEDTHGVIQPGKHGWARIACEKLVFGAVEGRCRENTFVGSFARF